MTAIKGAGNNLVTYNSNALTNYINSTQLNNTIAELESTHMGSTAETSDAGLVNSTLDIGGDWGATLDGYLGPDSLTGAKRTTVIQFEDGATVVSWTWTASGDVGGFITNWNVTSDAKGKLVWTAKLRLSGLGVRSVA